MAILYDARGNEYPGQIDQITNGVYNDLRAATATLAAANAEALSDLNGHATMLVDLRTAAGSLTLVFEGTIDGTNYFPLIALNLATGAYVTSVISTTTLNVQLAINTAGYRRVRVRESAHTSGNVTVAMRATSSDFSMLVERIAATIGLTNTGAAGAGVTLTLPAPATVTAGMFQYINWIRIEHFAAALLVAAAAPVIVTTTNLPGTPSFNFRADAAPQGTLTEKVIQCDMPIRAITANTAVTIVAPVATNVIWKLSASWRVGA